jgi:F0F1-type ATP synthase membrane subunit b/b'
MTNFELHIITSQFFWLFVTFILAFAFLAKFPLSKIDGIINARKNKIQDALENANYCKQEADKIESECELRIGETRSKSAQMIIDANKNINDNYNKKVAEIDEKINLMIKESNFKIEQFKNDSYKKLYDFKIKSAQFILKRLCTDVSEDLVKQEFDNLRGN